MGEREGGEGGEDAGLARKICRRCWGVRKRCPLFLGILPASAPQARATGPVRWGPPDPLVPVAIGSASNLTEAGEPLRPSERPPWVQQVRTPAAFCRGSFSNSKHGRALEEMGPVRSA